MEVRNKIVFIRKIADGPEQAGRDYFGLSLRTQLDLPLHSVLVSNVELRVGPFHVFLLECERRMGLVFLAAGPIQEVTGSDVARVPPKAGSSSLNASGFHVSAEQSYAP